MPDVVVPVGHDWTAPQWEWPLQHTDGIVKVHDHKEFFEVALDCRYFTPKEIQVRMNGDHVEIMARHDARNDEHGTVTREIFRSYKLPADIDYSTLKSHLTKRGLLFVNAVKKGLKD